MRSVWEMNKMIKKYESVDELKRSIYLWVLPFVSLAVLINSLMNHGNTIDLAINASLFSWFVFSWFLVFYKKGMRFGEYSNLLLISVYHIITVYEVIHSQLARTGVGDLGDFIVWMPLYFMLIFVTLGSKNGLFFSVGIFLVTLSIGLLDVKHLSSESIDSISQFYFANLVYILVLYYAQYLFRAYTEIEIFRKHAYVDSLTAIANRRRIDEWLGERLTAARQEHRLFSIIFFDIDHFKRVNDRYGHKIGDCVLKELSALVSENLEKGDCFGRWGGEEFILFTDSTGNQVWKKAEYLRKLVEQHRFKEAGKLTASFGIAEYRPGDDTDTLLGRADKALYESKHCGRNRVSVN